MMSEIVQPAPARGFSWTRALLAGLVATVVMTVVAVPLGMNFMKNLGSMLAPRAGMGAQYAIGGAVHLMIGLIYGVIYAWLVGRVSEWNPLLKGVVYGLAITAIALAAMPIMATMTGGAGPGNPCGGKSAGNPCHAKAAGNPCGTKAPANPCHPTAGNPYQPAGAPMNPCNPPKAAGNPCHPQAKNACHAGASNPCNPCGGSKSPYSGLLSVVMHLAYALPLAFVYGRR